MPDQLPFSARRLVTLARSFRAARVADARGQCLARSLDLALAAREQFGLELELVRWTVVGDPDFLDHWAVRLDATRTIDPTRVQVDGRRTLVGEIDAYPARFQRPRSYPAALLASAYQRSLSSTVDQRFTNAFARTCGVRLLRHDLGRAWHDRDVQGGLRAAAVYLQHLRCLAWIAATRALERRSAELLLRLHRAALPAPCAAMRAPARIEQPAPTPAPGPGTLIMAALHPGTGGLVAHACASCLLLCA